MMVPANIMMPPIVGTERLCSLRASPGSSTRCFSFATLISEGVAISTNKKAVLKEPNSSRKISDTSVVGLVVGWCENRQSIACLFG